MSIEENFDNLPNIHKNIDAKFKSMNQKVKEDKSIEEDITEKTKQIKKEDCINEITQFQKNFSENNNKFIETINKKKIEIVNNLDNFIKKLELDTNEHINNIEKLNMSEEEKEAEYNRCIEQLDDILSISDALKENLNSSQNNFLKFLTDTNPNGDPILSFLEKNINNLNKSNFYNHLDVNKKYSEKIFNSIEDPIIKNYIIASNEANYKDIKLKKMKINKNSDFPNIKTILVNESIVNLKLKKAQNKNNCKDDQNKDNIKDDQNKDNCKDDQIKNNCKDDQIKNNCKDDQIKNNCKNEFIEQISINNISKKDFTYLFNLSDKIINKNFLKSSNTIDFQKSKDFNDFENSFGRYYSFSINYDTKSHLSSKELNDNFVVLENTNVNEDNGLYINMEYNYPKIYIKNYNLIDINLSQLFSSVKILKLTSCKLSFNFLTIDNLNSFNNITELHLDNCDIVDENFNEIIYVLIKNTQISSNIKCISFKNNHLNYINFYCYLFGSPQNFLPSLEILDLSYNKIKDIAASVLSSSSNLKVFLLSNNHINSSECLRLLYDKYKKYKKSLLTPLTAKQSQNSEYSSNTSTSNKSPIPFLFLLANNHILLKDNNMKEYLEYLVNILNIIDFPLKSLDFSGLFYKRKDDLVSENDKCQFCNHHNILIKQINLSRVQGTLIDINLSLCNITDEELAPLLLNNLRVINIKKINLSNNNLTDEIFKLLIDNKMYDIYNKIKSINLSGNVICLNKVEEIINFVKLFDSLKEIIIKDTVGEENINNYIRKKIIIFNESQNGQNELTKFNNEELIVQELIENKKDKPDNNFSNNSHVKLIMTNTIDYKFIEAAQKIYPELFEKIDIKI